MKPNPVIRSPATETHPFGITLFMASSGPLLGPLWVLGAAIVRIRALIIAVVDMHKQYLEMSLARRLCGLRRYTSHSAGILHI